MKNLIERINKNGEFYFFRVKLNPEEFEDVKNVKEFIKRIDEKIDNLSFTDNDIIDYLWMEGRDDDYWSEKNIEKEIKDLLKDVAKSIIKTSY